MLFTTVNKRTWRIELVDQLTAPIKLAVFRLSLNQETSVSALLYSRGSNNATWTRRSGQADPPETSTYKWLAARYALIGPRLVLWPHTLLLIFNERTSCVQKPFHSAQLCSSDQRYINTAGSNQNSNRQPSSLTVPLPAAWGLRLHH